MSEKKEPLRVSFQFDKNIPTHMMAVKMLHDAHSKSSFVSDGLYMIKQLENGAITQAAIIALSKAKALKTTQAQIDETLTCRFSIRFDMGHPMQKTALEMLNKSNMKAHLVADGLFLLMYLGSDTISNQVLTADVISSEQPQPVVPLASSYLDRVAGAYNPLVGASSVVVETVHVDEEQSQSDGSKCDSAANSSPAESNTLVAVTIRAGAENTKQAGDSKPPPNAAAKAMAAFRKKPN